jgi:hypothetical protein
MRSIGFPEMLTIVAVALILAVVTVGGGVLLWVLLSRRQAGPMLASRSCAHCHQQIPLLGSFCPLCGQRI